LETVHWHLERRQKVVHLYEALLPGVEQQRALYDEKPSNWMFTVLVPKEVDRDEVMRRMAEEGIETRPAFVPMHQLPMYGPEMNERFPVSTDIGRRGINLPTHAGLDSEQVMYITEVFQAALNLAGGRKCQAI
jgi:perosamine synthetase